MTTYNTGNPLGSTAVKDLYDNAENFDSAMNDRSSEYWGDRLGKQRLSWHGAEEAIQRFLLSSGYQDLGDYAAGIQITSRNQIFRKDGELYRAGAGLDLPYILTGDWATEGPNFVSVGDAALRQEIAEPSGSMMVGFQQSGSGSVSRNAQQKMREKISPRDFGATGDGTENDTSAFTKLEGAVTGRTIDLDGLTYVVDAIPTGNVYVNGAFSVDGSVYVAAQDAVTLGAADDTGGTEPVYTGGVNDTPTFSGRSTWWNRAMAAASNCRVMFVRGWIGASIYTTVKSNVGAALASRQCFVNGPQASTMSAEECQSYGFRAVHHGSVFGISMGSTVGGYISRNHRVSGTLGATLATETCQIGGGKNFRGSVTVVDGVPTAIVIERGGEGYNPATDLMVISDRSATGSGTVNPVPYTVDSNGTVIAASPSGGTGYSQNTEVIITCGVSTSAVIASNNSKVLLGENNGILGTSATNVAGTASVALASQSSHTTAGFSRQFLIGTTSGITAANGAGMLGSTISEVTADQAVLVSSRRSINNLIRSFAGGDAVSGSALTSNLKARINMGNGNATFAGNVNANTPITDLAKLYPNKLQGVEIPVGALVTLDGEEVRLAVAGDEWLSAHSRSYVILFGADEFGWAHKYLTDEYGEKLMQVVDCVYWEEITDQEGRKLREGFSGAVSEALRLYGNCPEDAVFGQEKCWIENPDYDPSLDASHEQRIARRGEWTPVCHTGEVHVNVDATVGKNDWVGAGDTPGVGTVSAARTDLRCKRIKVPFDAAKGYAIALCSRG